MTRYAVLVVGDWLECGTNALLYVEVVTGCVIDLNDSIVSIRVERKSSSIVTSMMYIRFPVDANGLARTPLEARRAVCS